MNIRGLISLGLVFITSPAWGGDSCRYLEDLYPDGTVKCQSEQLWRCDDGDWHGVGKRCINGATYEKVKKSYGRVVEVTAKTVTIKSKTGDISVYAYTQRTDFEDDDGNAIEKEAAIRQYATVYSIKVDGTLLMYRMVVEAK